ncbi:MAG: hypothetical protein AAFX05_11360 [Planctomycetota bacterium]
MNRIVTGRVGALGGAAVLLALCAGGSFAQDGDRSTQPRREAAPPTREGAARSNVADPTQPPDELLRALGQTQNGQVVAPPPPPLPEIRLRARVVTEGRPAAALLEIDETLVLVHEGTELSINTDKQSASITVAKLTMTEVRLEMSEGERKLILQ